MVIPTNIHISIEKKIIWILPTNGIPLDSEEGTFFVNFIVPLAHSNRYRESGPNKMAPLASILWDQQQ